MSEDRLLGWLRRQSESLGRNLGDDAAVLPAAGPRAVTVDSQIAGVHLPADPPPAVFARRLLAVCLSDLAAMGAAPEAGLLALATPPGFDHRSFFRAFLAAAHSYRVELVGGDLAGSPRLAATLTLWGSLPRGGRWLQRSGARPGHRLWVGGTLGESAAGRWLLGRGARLEGRRVLLPPDFERPAALARAARKAVRRHLLPTPQLELGRTLGRLAEGAAMDVSDGLARDLPRLCRESGVGARVQVERLPMPRELTPLCERLGKRPEDLLLGGGEDYVLLFTLPPEISSETLPGCMPIGEIVRGAGCRWMKEGSVYELLVPGWDHLTQ